MSDEMLWITVGTDDREPTAAVMEQVKDALDDQFDREVIITAGSIDTITADEASEFINQLTDALEEATE
jgi:hypothetical protein